MFGTNLKYSFTVNNGIVYIPILHMKSLPKWKGTASIQSKKSVTNKRHTSDQVTLLLISVFTTVSVTSLKLWSLDFGVIH